MSDWHNMIGLWYNTWSLLQTTDLMTHDLTALTDYWTPSVPGRGVQVQVQVQQKYSDKCTGFVAVCNASY